MPNMQHNIQIEGGSQFRKDCIGKMLSIKGLPNPRWFYKPFYSAKFWKLRTVTSFLYRIAPNCTEKLLYKSNKTSGEYRIVELVSDTEIRLEEVSTPPHK